jgi:hypothetical protein
VICPEVVNADFGHRLKSPLAYRGEVRYDRSVTEGNAA